MEWLGGFILGIIADAIRSVAAPTSTDWLRRFVPSEQRKSNLEDNRLRLEIMEKLKALGLDPDLASHADKDINHFSSVLQSQSRAFVETSVEKIVEHYQTQLEMNEDAASRSKIARAKMDRVIHQIEFASFFLPQQHEVLPVVQSAWEEYAKREAEFVAAAYHGGSMMPLIYHSTMEALIISRTAELQKTYNEQSER